MVEDYEKVGFGVVIPSAVPGAKIKRGKGEVYPKSGKSYIFLFLQIFFSKMLIILPNFTKILLWFFLHEIFRLVWTKLI